MKTLLPIALFLASLLATWLIPTRPDATPQKNSTPSLSTRKTSPKSSPQKNARHELAKIARLQDPQTRLQNLIALANSIPIDQLETWLTAQNLAPLDPSLRTLLLTITCDRWLAAAPADLIKWNARTYLVDTTYYLARWLTQDRETATDHLLNKTTGFGPSHALSETIKHLVKLDLTLAVDFIKERLQPKHKLHFHTQQEILFTLAKQDPDAIRRLAPDLPGYLQNSIAAALVGGTLQSDFPTAISQLATHKDGIDHLLATRAMIGNDTFIETLAQNTKHLPAGWLEELMTGYNFCHSSKTLPLLESTPAELGVSEKAFANLMFRQQWHDFGPENRPRLLAILNNPNLSLTARKNLLNGQLQYWLQNPSDQLADQLNSLQDPALRDLVLKDHESIEALLEKRNPNAGTNLPVHQHTDWTPSQTSEALAIFKNASPTDQRNTIREIKKAEWGSQPNRPYLSKVLATIAAQNQPTDPGRKDQDLSFTATFASDWALDSPAQAAAWVQKLPQGDHRLQAAKNVARTWQLYSPTEAAAWIKTLPSADQSTINSLLQKGAR